MFDAGVLPETVPAGAFTSVDVFVTQSEFSPAGWAGQAISQRSASTISLLSPHLYVALGRVRRIQATIATSSVQDLQGRPYHRHISLGANAHPKRARFFSC